jgi:hypothetical protein
VHLLHPPANGTQNRNPHREQRPGPARTGTLFVKLILPEAPDDIAPAAGERWEGFPPSNARRVRLHGPRTSCPTGDGSGRFPSHVLTGTNVKSAGNGMG